MKFNKWTLGLAAVGAVSMASAVRADEAPKLVPLNTLVSSTTISGYVDIAAQYNLVSGHGGAPWTPTTANGTSGVTDGFAVNDVDVALDKPLDESPWASGYHIEFNAGQSAVNATIGSSVGLRQAYVALRTPVGNGIDWKIGAFDGVTGYEGNTGYSNPNYSRSYGYALNPASQVGIIGAYKIINEVTVQAGFVNRDVPSVSDENGTPPGSSKSYVLDLALTAPDSWGWFKGSTLNLGTVQTFDDYGQNNYNASLTFNTPLANLKGGLSYDKLQTLGYNGGEPEDGAVYGVYATYQATDKLGFNLRGEYLDAVDLDDTFTIFGQGEEVTATIEYDIYANVVTRAEFRWDHTEHSPVFNAGRHEDAYLLALNVVYKF